MKRIQLAAPTLTMIILISSTAFGGNIGGLRTASAGNIGGMRTSSVGNIAGLSTNPAGNIGGTRSSAGRNTNGLRNYETATTKFSVALAGNIGGLLSLLFGLEIL